MCSTDIKVTIERHQVSSGTYTTNVSYLSPTGKQQSVNSIERSLKKNFTFDLDDNNFWKKTAMARLHDLSIPHGPETSTDDFLRQCENVGSYLYSQFLGEDPDFLTDLAKILDRRRFIALRLILPEELDFLPWELLFHQDLGFLSLQAGLARTISGTGDDSKKASADVRLAKIRLYAVNHQSERRQSDEPRPSKCFSLKYFENEHHLEMTQAVARHLGTSRVAVVMSVDVAATEQVVLNDLNDLNGKIQNKNAGFSLAYFYNKQEQTSPPQRKAPTLAWKDKAKHLIWFDFWGHDWVGAALHNELVECFIRCHEPEQERHHPQLPSGSIREGKQYPKKAEIGDLIGRAEVLVPFLRRLLFTGSKTDNSLFNQAAVPAWKVDTSDKTLAQRQWWRLRLYIAGSDFCIVQTANSDGLRNRWIRFFGFVNWSLK